MMVSATLTSDIDTLKHWYCRNPVLVELEDQEENDAPVTQYIVKYVPLLWTEDPQVTEMYIQMR